MTDHLAMQCVGFGLLMLSAHFFGRLALKLKIGQIIGQVFGGIFVGPYFLKLIGIFEKINLEGYKGAFDSFHFFLFAFLGVIAFALGEELHIDRLKQIGKKAAIISLIESSLTWVLLTALFLFAGLDWPIALVIGSIGIATAPAITFVLLNQLEIEGRFRNLVANLLVIDDILEIIIFSILVQIAARVMGGGDVAMGEIALHIGKEFGIAILLGFAVFAFLKLVVRSRVEPEPDIARATIGGTGFLSRILSAHPTPSVEILVIVIGTVMVGVGLGLAFHVPFLITGILAGILISNFHTHVLFDSLKIENIMPVLNLVFFALIGANIHFDVFFGANILLVVGYVLTRGFSKIVGVYIGCKVTKQDPKVTSCLPFLMLPQAGVAAVEAVYVASVLGAAGEIVLAIVLPSLVIFEIVGITLSERTLLRWRQWTMGEEQVLSTREKVFRETLAPGANIISNLAEYVPVGLADIKLKSTNLVDAIEALANRMRQDGHVVNIDTIVQQSLSREKMGSTAIGGGVAIPHCKLLGIKKICCAIGSLEEPLKDIEGPDDMPIKTVILLVSPMEDPENHLKALSTIAHIFSIDESRDTFIRTLERGEIEKILRTKQGG